MVAAGFQILQDEKSPFFDMIAATMLISSKLLDFTRSELNVQQANRTFTVKHKAAENAGLPISSILMLLAGISLFFGALISIASHKTTHTAATTARQHLGEHIDSEYGTASTTATLLNEGIEQSQPKRMSFQSSLMNNTITEG